MSGKVFLVSARITGWVASVVTADSPEDAQVKHEKELRLQLNNAGAELDYNPKAVKEVSA